MADKGKLPGKTEFSGRRRTVTRKSGFKSAAGSTGGELVEDEVGNYKTDENGLLVVTFAIPQTQGQLSGFGLWFLAPGQTEVRVETDFSLGNITLEQFVAPNWSKVGSIWTATADSAATVKVTFASEPSNEIAIYEATSGVISHKYLDEALAHRPALLKNIHQISPEALFISNEGVTSISGETTGSTSAISKKSCNRCARFLPINIHDERAHLSFSNHCVAAHRRPCSHSGFGKLQNLQTGELVKLEYGFQLECRFCKKFEVNAAHNPRRTSGQMKEDGARRRSLELLVSELFGGSAQMLFRHEHDGLELADYVWNHFDRQCFNCGVSISSPREMHLDHTRPLALMWPLDSTATCLCGACNSQKRDRSPSDFYTSDQIKALAKSTGISEQDLLTTGPNTEALDLLVDRFDWFFDEFLQRPELRRERDGKITGELLVKALAKVMKAAKGTYPDIQSEYERRRA